jgi:type VI secretion system protein ImpE
MTAATEYFQQGKLGKALKSAKRDISSNPSDLGMRFLLFEILLLFEDFGAAEKELFHMRAVDSSFETELLLSYVKAERERHQLMTAGEGGVNNFSSFAQGDERMKGLYHLFFEVVHLVRKKKSDEAAPLAQQGWESVQHKAGAIDGEKFSVIRDANALTCPFLEVLTPGEYHWVPFERIRKIEFLPPTTYLDEIWKPAFIETENASGEVKIPTLYSGVGKSKDHLKLGRGTEFHPCGKSGLLEAIGQRELLYFPLGGDQPSFKGIREVREITFE